MSKSHLPRRTFLRGVGAALALPLLDAMSMPLQSAQVAGGSPRRMAFVFFPNGAIMRDWTPSATGNSFELPATLQPLAEWKSHFSVLSGLAQDNGRDKGDGPGDHARGAASFLTGAHPYKTDGADIRNGISVDQVAAAAIGHETRLPSLELGLEPGRASGDCDSGYSCAYSNTISWKSANTPMAKEIHPRLVFERLFGRGRATVKARRRNDFFRRSILDVVAEDAARLKNRLGTGDRRKVDEYFTSVREIEVRIARSARFPQVDVGRVAVPDSLPEETEEHMRLMYDLLVLAFRTDTTRTATLMLANEGSNRTYPMVGVKDGHHEISHHQDDAEKIEKIARIDRFFVEHFARFLKELHAAKEEDHSLLDQCMIVYGSGISDGNRHDHHDLPILLCGHGGGTIKTGMHLKTGGEVPLNNLFLSLLDRMGVTAERFGDSTGRLTSIEV